MNNEKAQQDIFPEIPNYPYINGIGTLFYNIHKRILKMEVGKGLMAIINILGISVFSSAFYLAWINVDVFTRTVLSLVALAFGVIKVINGGFLLFHKIQMWKFIREKERMDIEDMRKKRSA